MMATRCLLTVLAFMLWCADGFSQEVPGQADADTCVNTYSLPDVLNAIYGFRDAQGQLPDSVCSDAYMKYNVDVKRRNIAMFFVPKVDVLLTGGRKMLGESVNRVTFFEGDRTDSKVLANSYTLTKSGSRNLPDLTKYLTPYIYNSTIFKSYVFSPFHRDNRRLYKYKMQEAGENVELTFTPRIKNPQLIKGRALVNPKSGHILSTDFKCNFRMYKLQFNIAMNDGTVALADTCGQAAALLLPKRCDIHSRMRFLWNKVDINYENTYELGLSLPDTIQSLQDRKSVEKLRPYPLSPDEENVYARFDSVRVANDSLSGLGQKIKKGRNVLTDYGRQLFRRQSTNIAGADINLTPLIDPMQLIHSSTKGVIYRIKSQAVVRPGPNSAITFSPAGAYNFRRKQYYFELPLVWDFNLRHNAHISANMRNTDPISSTGIKYELKRVSDKQNIDFDTLSLKYFRNLQVRLDYQYSFKSSNRLNTGIKFYRRSPLKGYEDFNDGEKEKTNYTFAPYIEWTQRLWKGGPTFNFNYEQGIMNVMGGDNSYGKQETDLTWKIPLRQLRTVSLRLGGGCYLFNNRNRFLDYNKFRENNLQEHWNDRWTSDFQLIDRRWYNASDFYIRSNVTYESPLFLLSWIPSVGSHIRMERIYINNLVVEDFHPYSEVGYGFATKAFSFAGYVSFMNGRYNTIGCKFALELYSSHY